MHLSSRAAPPAHPHPACRTWAGNTRSARFAIDGIANTFWSDDGLRNGTEVGTPSAGGSYLYWLRVQLAAPTSIALVQLVIDQDMTYDVQTASSASGPWTTQASRACTSCTQNQWAVVNPVQRHAFAAPVTATFIQIAISFSGAGGAGACGGCISAGVPAGCTSPDFCSWCAHARVSHSRACAHAAAVLCCAACRHGCLHIVAARTR
jgi:hypothetical protein